MKTLESKTRDRLTQEQKEVIREIRRLHRRGEALNLSAVKRNHPQLIHQAYSIKPFWGWKCAVDAAGIDYAEIKMEFEEYIICEICGKEYMALSAHLKSHETDLLDYWLDYPDTPSTSEALRVHWTMMRRRWAKKKF